MENLLGFKLKDIVTGIEGIAICKAIFLNGCIQYSLQSQVGKDGIIPKEVWVDRPQLEIIDKGVSENSFAPIRADVPLMPVPGGGFRSHPD